MHNYRLGQFLDFIKKIYNLEIILEINLVKYKKNYIYLSNIYLKLKTVIVKDCNELKRLFKYFYNYKFSIILKTYFMISCNSLFAFIPKNNLIFLFFKIKN